MRLPSSSTRLSGSYMESTMLCSMFVVSAYGSGRGRIACWATVRLPVGPAACDGASEAPEAAGEPP